MTRYYIIGAIVLLLLIWPIELAILYSHIVSYKRYWTKQNAEPDQPNQLLYVALGDSTAQGIGASTPQNSYPYLVKEWLQMKTGRPVKLVNFSVSGAKVEDAIKVQLPLLKNLKPTILTVEIGANDMKSYDSVRFTESMKYFVSQLPKASYVSEIPAFTGRAKDLDKSVVDANERIREIVQTAGLHQVPLYDITRTTTGLSYFAADYFHPNNKAYKNWANAFTAALQSVLSK